MLFLTDDKFMTSEFTFRKNYSIKAKYWSQQHFIFQPPSFKSITSRDHPFSTYVKFTEKLIFLPPDMLTNLWVSGGKKCRFFGESGLCTKWMIFYLHQIQLLIYSRIHSIYGKTMTR